MVACTLLPPRFSTLRRLLRGLVLTAAAPDVACVLRRPPAQDNGLVKDVFTKETMKVLDGHMGIGHVRYPTAGSSTAQEAQPFFVNSPLGIYLVRIASQPLRPPSPRADASRAARLLDPPIRRFTTAT